LPLNSGDEVKIPVIFCSIKQDSSTADELLNPDIAGLWENRKIANTPGFARKLRFSIFYPVMVL